MTTPTPTPSPMGAESPIEVTFPDGTTATFDQLREMLDEFHDGELDEPTRDKIRYALEHCPRLSQESSVIIGISRLLKSYEGPPVGSGANVLSDDQLRSKILGKLQNEPPPPKPAGFPWGAVVIGVVTLAVAAGIALYIVNLNNQAAPSTVNLVPKTPHDAPPPQAQPSHAESLKTMRILDVIDASIPSVTLLQGKATLTTSGEMAREFTPGETVTLVDGQQVEVLEGAMVLVTGKGKGTLKIDNPKTAASAQNKLTIEYQNGRLPVVTSVELPKFMATEEMPFGFTWHSPLSKQDMHRFFLPNRKENGQAETGFIYTGKIYPEGGATEKPEFFDEKAVQWFKQ